MEKSRFDGYASDASRLVQAFEALSSAEVLGPVAEFLETFREAGLRLHASPRIGRVHDCLPFLTVILQRGEQFDLVPLVAVWQDVALERRVTVQESAEHHWYEASDM